MPLQQLQDFYIVQWYPLISLRIPVLRCVLPVATQNLIVRDIKFSQILFAVFMEEHHVQLAYFQFRLWCNFRGHHVRYMMNPSGFCCFGADEHDIWPCMRPGYVRETTPSTVCDFRSGVSNLVHIKTQKLANNNDTYPSVAIQFCLCNHICLRLSFLFKVLVMIVDHN